MKFDEALKLFNSDNIFDDDWIKLRHYYHKNYVRYVLTSEELEIVKTLLSHYMFFEKAKKLLNDKINNLSEKQFNEVLFFVENLK